MKLFKIVMIGALALSVAYAQDTKPKKPAPAKPAAPAKSAPASKGSSTPSTASKGPTTSGRGATTGGATTAGRGATAAGRGPSTASPTARGATTNPAGRGAPASSARGGTPAGRPGGAPAGRPMAGGGRVPAGSHVTRTAGGHEVVRRANGRPADVRTRNGMAIHHGLNGSRRVAVERADHSRIVADRRGHGYVQHPYMYHGHAYMHRTYYANGRAYDRFYRGYNYHGVYVEAYAPAVYFAPAFYGWAYNPWVAPISFSWGFAAAPWYGAYGFYFAPYPVYPSAAFWLTDYIISQQLAAAYAAQAQANAAAAAAGGQPVLTPDVKNMIADEVKRQIALENQEAQTTTQGQEVDPSSSGIGRELSDGQQHVFVAGSDLDVTNAAGAECAISEGDALQLAGPPAADATAANLIVLASKGGQECRKGDTVAVSFEDLQNMQNAMRETIGQGMTELQAKQGTGGLPAAPASAKAAPVKTEFAQQAPPPDADVANQVNQQLAQADTEEKQALADAPADGSAAPAATADAAAPAAPPATISLGQTIDEVTAILGPPKSIVDLGPKKIYVYKDMKVTFNSGKVVDVQ